jgi:MFS superfamily sulfate permease-like transporter
MNFKTIYAILFFSGLHALGGLLGGIVGAILIKALTTRKVQTIIAETSGS